MKVDDTELAKAIVIESDFEDRYKDMPRDDVFLDARGAAWARGKISPQSDHHRVFAIFDSESSDYVTVYGVPMADKYGPYEFKRWLIHRSGMQHKEGVGIPCVVASMTIEVFRREIGERLWSAWVESTSRRQTREAAEAMQSALEVLRRMGAAGDLTPAQAAAIATDVLRDLDLLDEDGPPGELDPPPPPSDAASEITSPS
jgi:hypothetical protein